MRLGPLEREVMARLWDSEGSLTVREVHRSMSGKREIAYTTVSTSLSRMVDKGYVERRVEGQAHRFSARVTREDFFDGLVTEAFDILDGSNAAMGFVGQLDESARKALQEALECTGPGPEDS